ncbi:MAG: phosphate acetyltransferase [Candidatus Margulisbacteria bacterium]|nr:phosphate acetyltransferase [Candidatus Margulisiibacteriota bacterium]
MDFIKETWNKAKALQKTIVLPETEDARVLKAAELIVKSKLAKIILIGEADKMKNVAGARDVDLSGAKIIDPFKHPQLDKYVQVLKEKRASKGMTIEKARQLLTREYPYFGAMLVDQGEADAMVSGATHYTADTLRATIDCIGKAPNQSIISSFFVMVLQDKNFGEEGVLLYADCGVVPNPSAEQLADIAIQTSESFNKLIGRDPRVAMLSFSTKTSAVHPDVDKVITATKIAKEKRPALLLDGELQLDAALIPDIGRRKAPGSLVAGQANILIFPDLDAGNIGYKLTERLAHAQAFGPLLQGEAKVVNDLSRGCSIEDIINVTAISAVQAQ